MQQDKETILDEAKRLVYGDRNDSYGHPADDYQRTAKMMTGILSPILKEGEKVTPQLAILCMIAVKVSRQVNHPKRDNLVDLAGYALCLDRVERRLAGDPED